MRYEKCEQCGRWVTAIALSSNAFLAILKFVVGVASGSRGCIADSLHSATIFVTALALILGERLAGRKQNDRFHYGYGKLEPVITGCITLLIVCGAGVLIWNSIGRLASAALYGPPHLSALPMALTSIAANHALARYLRCVGSQFKSRAILACAWAHRENLLSSYVVLFGVIGAELGFGILDPLAAILVVALIMKACINIVLDSVKTLMDFSVNAVYGADVKSIVREVDGVQRVSGLRTRQIGDKIWLDLDICVDSKQSIREANLIASRVRNILLKRIGDIERIIINCAPEESHVHTGIE